MKNTYLQRQRHILLDMHLPDGDERFLSRYDPRAFVDLCAASGADAVMIYCNSHAGLCNWPTRSGRMHAGLGGTDVVGATLNLLRERGIAVCAYYSTVFNNWAYTEHPEWRMTLSDPGTLFGDGGRVGVCCPNNPGFQGFMLDQTGELADAYDFDAFFFDVLFWPGICVCGSCRDRYRAEEGTEIPTTVDWHDAAWCRFQAARERWLLGSFQQLRDRVRETLDIPVFHNSSSASAGWRCGGSHGLITSNDVVGGDFASPGALARYVRVGPPVRQLMHNVSGYSGGVSQLKTADEVRVHALTATALGAQFMAIDAVEPDGSVNPATYELLGEVFAAMKPYEAHLGGAPVTDVAIYWSPQSDVSLAENGTGIDQTSLDFNGYKDPLPHSSAVEGAATLLGEAHLPVGIITRSNLAELAEFPVVVLPNVLRMEPEEVEAFRRYVERGGRLYASGYTSLLMADGTRHDDFALADVFGCHLVGEEAAALTYLKPATPDAEEWIAPVRYVPNGEPWWPYAQSAPSPVRLTVDAEPAAEIVATTTLPFNGGFGTRDDGRYASVFTSPPWEDTDRPAVVRHRFGQGEVVYSSAVLEAAGGRLSDPDWSIIRSGTRTSERALFLGLVRSLLDRPPTFEADAHPDVLMTAFHEPENATIRLCLLNHASTHPVLPIPRIAFQVAPPPGRTFTRLRRVPSSEPVPFTVGDDGRLQAEVRDLTLFEMLAADYE